MTKQFVQLEEDKVVTVFGGEPNVEYWPDYTEIEEEDSRYVDFINLFNKSTDKLILENRDTLLRDTALKIAPLQYAVDLKIQTASELNLLKAWKEYSVALNRVQDQSGFPESVVWPEAPPNV